MIVNILVIGFLGMMIYWWAVQGLFSAFLHLMVTITAAALALAFWEPLVINVLLYRMPYYAWAVGLVGPFVLLLIGLRLGSDTLVPQNVMFDGNVNMIGGGLCGLLSGMLAAGICLIGLNMMVMPAGMWNFIGYQPYTINESGVATANSSGRLYVPVDRVTASFFNTLSRGAYAPVFSSSSLALHRPNLRELAAISWLRDDPNASTIASPNSVEVTGLAASPTPVPQMSPAALARVDPKAAQPNHQLIVADTVWKSGPEYRGTYDGDATLRLYPSQLRLVSWVTRAGRPVSELHAPSGFVEIDHTGKRRYHPVDSITFFRHSTRQEAEFGFVFVIPQDHEPKFLIARQLRLPMPQSDEEIRTRPSEVQMAIGSLPFEAELVSEDLGGGPARSDPGIGARVGANVGSVGLEIQVSRKLPRVMSRNKASGLSFRDTDSGGCIQSGRGYVPPPDMSLGRNVRVEEVCVPSHQELVRLKLARNDAQSLLGAARVAGANIAPPTLRDNRGENWNAIGFVMLDKSEAAQEVRIERTGIRSMRTLPVNRMDPGDELYLYFAVPRDVNIVAYQVGRTRQDVNLQVP